MNKIAPTILTFALAFVFQVPTAQADNASRNYSLSASSVMDNCGKDGIQLSTERAMVSESGSGVRVAISGLPDLIGLSDKRGKLRLSAKQSQSRISAKGRESRDSLQLVLIIEQFQAGKPTCTQSFSLRGKRI